MEDDPNSEPFSPCSVTSSPPTKTYDVFLSFRGEDTRHNFTSHLYGALRQKGIFYTFKDDIMLDRGKDIGPELMNAIQDSQYAVVVLSENYATSSWCLKELAQIVECMGDSGRIWTIFYHVNPSHVRHVKSTDEEEQQESRFWKALADHAKDPEHSEYVESWRDALFKVGNKRGDPVVEDHTDEGVLIKDFVENLSRELGASIKTLDGLFGMITRLKELDSCVRRYSLGDVRFIGVHGIGGIGKSTLAKAYYNRKSHKFDGRSCYLQNVRETCEKRENGLVHLQNLLLSDILVGPFGEIRNDGNGIDMIRSRLRNRKVLIVLDDVTEVKQLEALGVEDKLLGPGSVIIMTTRNVNLFDNRCEIYEVKQLDGVEALQLFSSKAFGSFEPPDEYKELSKQVVEYCENIPLALKVLGSLLRRKRKIVEWEGLLNRLRQSPEENISKNLKISFDDLNEEDKCIFLDIACFFKGCDIEDVIPILDACNLNPRYGIGNLVDRSLLEMQHGKKVWMRDLLQQMGQEIARQGSDKSGRPSRLWDVNQLKSLLTRTMGMENMEAIVVTFQEENQMPSFRGLSRMEKLRLLMVLGTFDFQPGSGDSKVPELDYLSNELYLLEWNRFPFKKFPSSFVPYNLVELKLIESNLQRLWNKSVKLPKLKVIDLRDSRCFSTFEDFNVTPNLEILILDGCMNLVEIHRSITVLHKLIILSLKLCTSLKRLPSMKGLNSLRDLNLNGCSEFCYLPEDIAHLHQLRKLDVRECGIKFLPPSITPTRNLEILMSDNQENEDIASPSENPELSKTHRNVFFSFRGIDVPHGLLSRLYEALSQRGFHVHRDDFVLGRGKDISSSILKAIDESYVLIAIVTENYASSRWCLSELAKIVELIQPSNHIVVPVFYHVEPSYVRDQSGDALRRHENNPGLEDDELSRWKKALRVIGNLTTGWRWILRETDIEAHFIRDFVEYLSEVLHNPSIYFSEQRHELYSPLDRNDEINPTIGEASVLGEPSSSKMLDPSDDDLSNESFCEKDREETTAFTSVERHFQAAVQTGMMAHPLSTKLDSSNFPRWRMLATAEIDGNGNLPFIQSNAIPPPEFLTDADKKAQKVNPEFTNWHEGDQNLLRSLVESMTPQVRTQMVGCKTSLEVWEAVDMLFSSKSKAHTMRYKLQLLTTKKGGLSMQEYLLKMKSLIDVLASAGHIISEDDQILHVLSGLSAEYDDFVNSVIAINEPLTMQAICAMLLAHES